MSEGESLGSIDHMQTLMMRLVSTVCIAHAASSVSTCDQSRQGSSPLSFKLSFQIITHIKQSGGGELGGEATTAPNSHRYNPHFCALL